MDVPPISAFPNFPELTAVFTTRIGGKSSSPYQSLNLGFSTDDSPHNIRENWNRIRREIGLNKHPFLLKQVHSNKHVQTGFPLEQGLPPCADALYAVTINEPIAVLTADCLPILLYNSKYRTIAAIHAGWRGTQAHILPLLLQNLQKKQLLNKSDTHLTMGPCIQACHFEVGEEVHRVFEKEHRIFKDGKRTLSLQTINRTQAVNFGIPIKNIRTLPQCTFCDSAHFFSYRRDGSKTGRMAAIIQMQ